MLLLEMIERDLLTKDQMKDILLNLLRGVVPEQENKLEQFLDRTFILNKTRRTYKISNKELTFLYNEFALQFNFGLISEDRMFYEMIKLDSYRACISDNAHGEKYYYLLKKDISDRNRLKTWGR
jgi:hypothetical protein